MSAIFAKPSAPPVKLIADNSAVYSDVLRNFSRDYADITDILKYICGRFHIDFITGRGVVYPLIIGQRELLHRCRPRRFGIYGILRRRRRPSDDACSLSRKAFHRLRRDSAHACRQKPHENNAAAECGKILRQELADMLGLSPNTVSHHMNKLQKSGLTTSTLEGCKVYYKTNEEVVDEFIRRLAEKLKTKDGQ